MSDDTSSKNSDIFLDTPKKIRPINDKIKILTKIPDLFKLRIDLNSPRFLQACENLGVLPEECKFTEELRYRLENSKTEMEKQKYSHDCDRMLFTINKVLKERNNISIFITNNSLEIAMKKKKIVENNRNDSEVSTKPTFLTEKSDFKVFAKRCFSLPKIRADDIESCKKIYMEKLNAEIKKKVESEISVRQMSRMLKERQQKALKLEKTQLSLKTAHVSHYKRLSLENAQRLFEQEKYKENERKERFAEFQQKYQKRIENKELIEKQRKMHYAENNEKYSKKVLEIRTSKASEPNDKNIEFALSKIESDCIFRPEILVLKGEMRKTKSTNILQMSLRKLQEKNEKKQSRIYEIRKEKYEKEQKLAFEFRQQQEKIFLSVVF